MRKTTFSRALRLLLETTAIFVGVSLGFFAENYREAQSDRARERETLGQLLADLRTDSLELIPILRTSEVRQQALTWISNNAAESSFTADSVQRVLTPMREMDPYWYVPGIFAYSSLKSSGRLDLIEDVALRDRIVFYFEDRVPYMSLLNKFTLEEEKEWWGFVAPYVAHEPRPVADQVPGVRVVDVQGMKADRRLLLDSGELAYFYFLQARLCRELYRLNQELADAVRAYVE